MTDETPRVVLFGNTAPISSTRDVKALADVDLDDLQARLADPDDALAKVVVDEERELVGTHEREPLEGVSVTRYVPPESFGLVEAVATALKVYETDHSNDPPEWVYCEVDPTIAEAISDHFRRQGHDCSVGIPEEWERKRSLQPAGLRFIQEANGELPENEGRPPIGGGALGTSYTPEEFGEEFLARWREHGLRTDAGKDFQSRVMGDTASTGTGTYAAANWLALTENVTAPAAGDTALTGELAAFGLARAQAAYAHTGGAATYTLTKTFTSSDVSTRTIQKVGVFNASSAGTLVFSTAVPSPPALVSGDSLTITETVSI